MESEVSSPLLNLKCIVTANGMRVLRLAYSLKGCEIKSGRGRPGFEATIPRSPLQGL